MSFRRSSRLAVAILTFVLTAIPIAAQPKNSQDPSQKPRKVKEELHKAFKTWLDKDVAYIITDEERRAFNKLETDDEREN